MAFSPPSDYLLILFPPSDFCAPCLIYTETYQTHFGHKKGNF